MVKNEKNIKGSYLDRTVYRDYRKGPVTARLYIDLTIYSSGSFREIVDAGTPYWREASSGEWRLERETVGSRVSQLEARVWGGANIVVTTTLSTVGSFSIDALRNFGFAIEQGTQNTYYARDTINRFEYIYSLY